MSETTSPEPPRDKPIRRHLGVIVDVFLTLVLLVVGFDPAYEVVMRHRRESAIALGVLHIIMVPAAILTALVRTKQVDLFTDKPSFVRQTIEMMFLLFYVFGWLMPILMFAQRVSVPSWLIFGCIFAHVAPIVVTVVLAVFKRAHWMDAWAFWISSKWEPQAVLYGAYLAGIEVFLLSARLDTRRFGPMPFLIWAGAYVPARLLLAKISGLQGLERWTFLAANVHLLIRLIIAGEN
ncbi:MAG TPA: hypothetical protein PKA58_22060 [Polyangium sp.]|jgi:hypothetical protein|nr:hypothetical protein [Polyangium sp.]